MVWWQILVWCNVPIPVNFSTVSSLLNHVERYGTTNSRKKVTNAIIQATIWNIWKARNNKVFKGYVTTWFKMVEDVKEMTYLWVNTRSTDTALEWRRWTSFNLGCLL
ncbi:hypothetical protein R6Q59_019691 [Mikania micrantha]